MHFGSWTDLKAAFHKRWIEEWDLLYPDQSFRDRTVIKAYYFYSNSKNKPASMERWKIILDKWLSEDWAKREKEKPREEEKRPRGNGSVDEVFAPLRKQIRDQLKDSDCRLCLGYGIVEGYRRSDKYQSRCCVICNCASGKLAAQLPEYSYKIDIYDPNSQTWILTCT